MSEFDGDPCDDLEDVWALGGGDAAGLWKRCQAGEKFDDATDSESIIPTRRLSVSD